MGEFDVSVIAQSLGGGGHKNAAEFLLIAVLLKQLHSYYAPVSVPCS